VKCPCILLLDVSSSMSGTPINELNEGLAAFQQMLQQDDLASVRVEVAIISFGSSVSVEQDFITANQFQAPILSPSGTTPMGQAINLALNMIHERKEIYKQNGVPYYRP